MSMSKTCRKSRLPVQQLLVGQHLFQTAGVLQPEGEHGGGGVGGEHLDDAHREGQRHVPRDLHDAPATQDRGVNP